MKTIQEMIKIKKNKSIVALVLLTMTMLLYGCGYFGDESTENVSTITGEVTAEEAAQYLIMEHDTVEEFVTLYNLETGYKHYYEYTFSTCFKDKYGKNKSASEFTAGDVVTLGTPDTEGYLSEVQMSDKVWTQDGIRRFSIDEEKGVLTIGNTKYSIREGAYGFSGGEVIALSEISKDDIISVTGIDKKVLSVVVTTGHGTLSLTNTDLFEGSLMQLNKDYFLEITENMSVEILEGTYTLTVANNGWGSSCEIEIVRGEKTEVDLDTLKGEGRKSGLITFTVNAENPSVYIDGKPVDISAPVEIQYGTHTLQIEAEGYVSWRKYLNVNSETATFVVSLTEDGESEDESESESEADSENDSEGESEDSENSDTTHTSEETESQETDTQSESEKRQEELDDLQETINDIIENTFGGIFD